MRNNFNAPSYGDPNRGSMDANGNYTVNSWDGYGNSGGGFGNSGGGFGNAGGDLGSLLGMLFGNSGYKNPSSAAMPYFDKMQNPANSAMSYFQQIPGAVSPFLTNYMQQGQSAFPSYQNYMSSGANANNALQGQFSQLMNDPSSVMNKIGANFQQSPGYQFQKDQMTNASNNAAAAGGFVGSPQAQQQMAQNIGGIASQDYNNYMNRGVGMYNTGLQGEEGINQMGFNAMSDLGHMGYGASGQMAQQLADALKSQGNMQFQGNEDMMNALMSQAKLAYSGQANQNEHQGGMWGALGSLAGMALPFLL